jgi:hypothetical protein
MLRSRMVVLRAATGERIETDDAGRRGHAFPAFVLIADEQPDLIQERRLDNCQLVIDGVLLSRRPVDARCGETDTGALISLALVVVRRP